VGRTGREGWATAGLENKGGGRVENKEKGISELKIGFFLIYQGFGNL
jgi:hypothetical protein